MNGFKKLPSVFLAGLLQLLPICRAVYTVEALPSCGFAVIARWAVGSLALMGYHAISSASNVINSPTTASGTYGSTFTYRITTTGNFSGQQYSAAPAPAGVTGLTNSSSSIVTGIPTAPGVVKMTVTVSETNYNSIQQVVTVTISPSGPPTITSQPVSITNAVGKTAVFTVGVADVSGYQWYFNSSPLAGATNTSLTLTNIQSTNAGSYYLTATNSLGSTNSANATLTVGYPPAILAQPQTIATNLGSNVTFSVAAATTNPPTAYQWFYNSNLISGATSSNYQILNVQTANAGSYLVVLTNNFGSVTSSVATLSLVGDFFFGDRGLSNVLCQFFGPDTNNPTLSFTGNTSADIPAGTQTYTGALLKNAGYTVQLWGAVGANLPESALAPIPGAVSAFLFTGGTFTNVSPNPVVPGAVEGSVATMELRIWNNEAGTVTNWTQVLANTNADRGVSPLFNSPPLGGYSPAPTLVGLQSFNTYYPSASGPAPVITVSSQVSNGQFSIGFNTTVGKTYTVQYESALSNSWQTLTQFVASVSNSVVIDSATNNLRFYRVLTTYP